MCGFLVTVGIDRPFGLREIRSLRKRGPDGVGFWTSADGKVRMAHTRLAIQGHDEQPVCGLSHVMAYNGEVYAHGASSDTMLMCDRPDPRTLNGFWSAAWYGSGELVLMRDQFGVKPLYYWHEGDKFVAATSIRAILDAIGQRPGLDFDAISQYVRYQLVFGERTFFQGIKRLLPGHFLSYRAGFRVEPRPYEDIWRMGTAEPTPEWIDTAKTLLNRAVLESTTADVPFTTLCSGGLDSSAITRLACPELAYHGNYSDADCNETAYAREVVSGTSTRLMVVNGQEDFDLVERLASIVADFDDLAVGSVVLPLDEVLSQVKRRFNVVLTGTGGDELFAGYVRYQLAMGQRGQDSYAEMFARTRGYLHQWERFEQTHRKGRAGVYRFYNHDAAVNGFRESYGDEDGIGPLLTFDRKNFLSGLLTIDDRIGGRHGIESRPSLLHQDFVRHVVTLAPDCHMGASLKPIWRQIVKDILPDSVLQRSDKMGFTTPIGSFVNRSASRIREQLSSSRHRELYDLSQVRWTESHKFGREVFGMLMLDLWLNEYAT